jgi:heparan-alpha-glucosaminide N-acetyltransferase
VNPAVLDTPSAPPDIIAAPRSKTGERLLSLDAYRGAIMLMMASAALGIPHIAKNYPDSAFWRFLGYQTEHAPWAGCSLWDLIQPAFMFMVGVALPWSIANRRARGASFGSMFGHAIWRGVALVALALLLQSNWSRRTDWTFPNVLAQIGLGYPIVFLLAFAKPRLQWIAAFSILIGYWLLFAIFPAQGPDFASHWAKNANFASAFDSWFLNLFPREKPFIENAGGYTTLNFVPSMATMIFGILAGQLLRSDLRIEQKLIRLVLFGVAGLILGKGIELAGLCPIVKRIWTPSWAIFSAGWVTLLLGGFVAAIDWKGWKRWAFPLIVAGLNPITLYVMWQIMGGWIKETFRIHLGRGFFETFGPMFVPTLERGVVLLVIWLVLYWMYRRKIFIRI